MTQFPSPRSAAMLEELGHYVIAEPFPFVVDLASSRGLTLATVDGEQIQDWTGLYGSRLLGYNHSRLFEPDYARELLFAANTKMANPDFLTPQCLNYYRLLHRLAPKCMRDQKVEVYAVNSGAEAVENMMKYLINLHNQKRQVRGEKPGPHRFIYFEQAFHGRTVFALNITELTHDPVATKDFRGLIQGNIQVPFPDYDARRSMAENDAVLDRCLYAIEQLMITYAGEISGLILEPLQGAGGHRMALPRFYQALSELCHSYDIGWGLDEVQTAGGQTGAVFSIDLFDVPYPPQAVAVAKKFGNGAVYMLNPMEDIGVLDSTWGGTLADMVRFVHEWRIVEDEQLLEQAPAKGEYLFDGLNSLADTFSGLIGNVRGLGLYQGFTVNDRANKGRLIDRSLEYEHLLLLGAGQDSVRFRPPLDVTFADMDDMLARLGRVLTTL